MRPSHFIIPELCTAGSLALLILFSQLLVVILIFAGGELSWLRFGLMSLFVQWVALGSAACLCMLRNNLTRIPLVFGALVSFLVVMVVTVAVGLAAEWAVEQGPGMFGRLFSYLTIAAIITGLVLRYFYVQQRLRLQEQSELQSRIQALQSRIRPHFLFNSMNIIASLIAVDPDTAESVVEDLSELFRASLNEAGNQVPISEELELCERYIRIEALRLGDRLQLDWQVENPPSSVQIPLLTLQPLLENAIYHGIQPLPEGGVIELRLHYEKELAVVQIRNPLPDQKVPAKTEGNRMALNNIRSRLNVLYGNRATLDTRVEQEVFVTDLRFPMLPEGV